MRKKRRSAAIITSAIAGATVVATGLLLMPMARAQEFPEITFSEGPSPEEQARPERVDYWEARAARDARRAEARGEEPVAVEPEAVAVAVAEDGGGGDFAPAPAGDLPSDEQLALLRDCESGGDYTIDTGNGYYGAYQFLPETWWGLGYEGYPHEAAPEVQDQAVRDLYAQSGWYPWPGCAAALGWL